MLFELPFFRRGGGGGGFGSVVGRDGVHRNARRRRRIRKGLNPTSAMNKNMNYISGMAEKTRVGINA